MSGYYIDHQENLSACGNNGAKNSPSSGEMERCQCCNRQIKKVAVMSDGARIGTECATVMQFLNTRPVEHWTESQIYCASISQTQFNFWRARQS
jgi:hypothetical protein